MTQSTSPRSTKTKALYNDHFFEDMIEKLDDVLADTLAPVQDQIEQGLDYHGGA